MPRPVAIGMVDDDGGFKLGKPPRTNGPPGIIETYSHAGGRIGALVELRCETDFVARTEEFRTLAREIAMQIAAMKPTIVGSMDSPGNDSNALLDQEYLLNPGITVRELIEETINQVGEIIQVMRFVRFEVGINDDSISNI